MTMIDRSEIAPGLVARLDTAALRAAGGSSTNAQITADADRAVTGVVDFLVLSVDPVTELAFALPLYPRSAPGSAPLEPARQSGPADWLGAPVYYSRWQHWRIPLDAFVAASSGEPTASGSAPDLFELACRYVAGAGQLGVAQPLRVPPGLSAR
jgi:hypothetical protein